MGVFRYFLAPAGLLRIEELPTGWGLIEVSPRGGLKVLCGHVLEKPQKALGFRRDTARWRHTNNPERETALLVRLLARVGDAETLQRSLKIVNKQLAHAQRTIDQQQAELRRALTQYWELRQAFDAATGKDPSPAARRKAVSEQQAQCGEQ
jgi:hypothetical protein